MSLLVIVWLVITCAGVSAIARATAVVQQRAEVQTHADAIVLAAASYGDDVARRFAGLLQVRVISLVRTGKVVTVRITANQQQATASAIQPL